MKAWQQWQNATATLTKKREAKAKAELAGKVERVGQLRQEIAEQERQQEMAQDNFDRLVGWSPSVKLQMELNLIFFNICQPCDSLRVQEVPCGRRPGLG